MQTNRPVEAARGSRKRQKQVTDPKGLARRFCAADGSQGREDRDDDPNKRLRTEKASLS